MRLSKLGEAMQGQPMFKILERAQELERQGRKIYHFELGEPDFDTPANIVNSAVKALTDGKTHYAPSSGLYDLRVAAAQTTEKSRGFLPSLDQILVTPGANSIIYLAIKCLVDPGDEVIVPDPGFPTYLSAIAACDATAVAVQLKPENQFAITPEDIEKVITPNTRLLILNSPSNPTGGVVSKQNLLKIALLCEKYGIFLLSDEIYGRLVFSGADFYSPGSYDKCLERTIIINGFSKAFAMTGWRLGIAIGPKKVIEKMGLLVSTIVSCVPEFIQWAGVEAINGDQRQPKFFKEQFEKRARYLVEGLNRLSGVTCEMPKGAIYAFANITGTGMTSAEFADFCLENASVAVTPGHFFGLHGEGFVRLSVVNSLPVIEEALTALKKVLNHGA
jgi:aspartate/methionine/tyrosine aminotransferase